MNTSVKTDNLSEHRSGSISTSSNIRTSASGNTLNAVESSIDQIRRLQEYYIEVGNDAETTIDNCLKKISSYKSAVTKLNEDSLKLQNGIISCKAEITKRGNLIKEKNSKIQNLTQNIKSKETEVQKLKSEISALRNQCSKLASDSKDTSKLIEALKEDIRKKRDLLEKYKTSPKYIVEQELKAKEQELKRLEREINQNKQELDSKTSEVQQLTQERDSLKSQRKESETKLADTKTQLQETEKKLQEAQNALKEIASHLSDEITGETKEIVLGCLDERLKLWELLPPSYQNKSLEFEIDFLGKFTGTLSKLKEQVNNLRKEIDAKKSNEAELARMEKLILDGILGNSVPAFVEISSRKHGEGANASEMYQIRKNPELQPTQIGGSTMYFAQQAATKIINQTFDEIQKSHNWTDKKRQEIEQKVNFDFNKFLEANPGKSAACYFNELAQIVRLTRIEGNKPQFYDSAVVKLSNMLVVCGVNGGNIDKLCSTNISAVLTAINSQKGLFNEPVENLLKDFLGTIKIFCAENNLDYDKYISSVSFSTLVGGTNFIEAVKVDVVNANKRKQEASDTLNRVVSYILNNNWPAFCDIVGNPPNGPFFTAQGQPYNSKVDSWPRFVQIARNPFQEPDANYTLSRDDIGWLAARMTDVTINQIGKEKRWSSDSINNTKKWVVGKFNEFVGQNQVNGQQYNVVFNRLSQLIRTTRIDGSVLTPAALKELQNVTVMCCIGGPDVRVTCNNNRLNNVYSMSISQAIEAFNGSGFLNNDSRLQLQNFLGSIHTFCGQNGLDCDQLLKDLQWNILVNASFKDECVNEIKQINALKQNAQQWLQWIAACIRGSNVVPVFLGIEGTPPGFDELGVPIANRPYVFFARLCDFCEKPSAELRDVSEYAIDDVETGLQKTLPIVAKLVIDYVHATAQIDQQIAGEKEKQIMLALNNFARINGDQLTYVNCLDQIAEVIRLNYRVLFNLPQQLNTQQVRNELLNVLIPYAANGGNLKNLYQLPILQAVNVLNRATVVPTENENGVRMEEDPRPLFPAGVNNLLQGFNLAIMNAISKSTQLAGAFMRNASISDLSRGITSFEGLMPKLPPALNTHEIQQELLSVFVPYARNGGNLKELYKLPISQAVDVLLQDNYLQQSQGFPPRELQNFLGAIFAVCGKNGQVANAFMNNASINDLSYGISMQDLMPKLPQQLNTQQVHNELLNVLIPYAANGGNLKALYQLPISQAIDELNHAGCFQPQQGSIPQELRNFLGGIFAACGGNEQNFYQFINTTSISALSNLQ